MANPKKKMSRSRRDSRRTHYVVNPPSLGICDHCGQAKLPHFVCPACGFYGGKKMIEVEEGV